jgi:hypothetical protein
MKKNSKLYNLLLRMWEDRGVDVSTIVDIYTMGAGGSYAYGLSKYVANIKNPKYTGKKGLFAQSEIVELDNVIYQNDLLEYLIENVQLIVHKK